MSHSPYWLEVAQKLQSLAQAGLTYTQNEYDIDRYEQLRALSVEIIAKYSETDETVLKSLLSAQSGYPTPKVDVRAVIFRDGKILMVKEKMDGHWSIPGGWADIGLSPFENAKKEVLEESGLEIIPVRLLAVHDKLKHKHPSDIFHAYKLFILCFEKGGNLAPGMETLDARFFSPDELPPLSIERNTQEQLELMFEYYRNPAKATICD
jgi:ADP-ribose pyrophosphatase YjhB (NUDIX family)